MGFLGLEQVNAPLGIPETLEVLGILTLGYPAQAIGKGKKKRKPLSEVASDGRFGNPFS